MICSWENTRSLTLDMASNAKMFEVSDLAFGSALDAYQSEGRGHGPRRSSYNERL